MGDERVMDRIEKLVAQEHELLGVDENHRTPETHERLRAVEVELDRCWDLLRQRRAHREFGANPDDAVAREAGTVEGYLQ